MKNKLLYIIVSIIMLITLGSCGAVAETQQNSASPSPAASSKPTPAPTEDTALKTDNVVKIEIDMEDGGVIKAELYPDIAPITVANFTKLCKEGFYDGLIFHRVIPGFMIQGGGYDTANNQKPASEIKGEFKANGVDNNLKHTRGVLSMARTMASNDSASSQFFIMHADYPSLDGSYAAFGKVTDGLDVVDKIASVQTTALDRMFQDYPVTPQVIKTIKVIE